MSEQIVGADPRQEPLTAAQLAAMQSSNTGAPPVVVVNTPPQNGQGRFFSEEDVARIRTEEKDKLYGRLEEMDSELKQLREEREARIKAEEEARQAAEAAEQARREDEMSLRDLLKQKDVEWEHRFQQVQREREQDRAVFEQERRFNDVQNYRRARIEQEAEYIMPELRDLITGSSEEEIDASIAQMKDRTAAILQSVQSAVTTQRTQMRGAAPTGQPPVGPMEQQTTYETLTPEDIRSMDMQTYAKYRDSLLKSASRNRGGR
jgi:hypothetical protein